MKPWQDPTVWESVASELRAYRVAGIGGLLTEDTVRFSLARALFAAGADPAGLKVEWPHPALRGSRIDLVAGGDPPEVLIELKYPREPNLKNAAWTMALGEILKDLYRLAVAPGDVDRLFVYVESRRLRKYMAASAGRYGLDLDVDDVVLRPEAVKTLPTTAAVIIGTELAAHHVTAKRMFVREVDDELRLAVYLVDAHGVLSTPAAELVAAESTSVGQVLPGTIAAPAEETDSEPAVSASLSIGTRDGARVEILRAARAVMTRSGESAFTLMDIIQEMQRSGTGYAEGTIRTMVTGHMCANAPNNAATAYDDLERVDRGVYRLYRGQP